MVNVASSPAMLEAGAIERFRVVGARLAEVRQHGLIAIDDLQLEIIEDLRLRALVRHHRPSSERVALLMQLAGEPGGERRQPPRRVYAQHRRNERIVEDDLGVTATLD